jgi:hypothetical protein
MILLAIQFLAGDAYAAAAFSKLTLQNGWTALAGSNAPSVSRVAGVVTLTGDIRTSGTNQTAFTLPAADRPTTEVYVPIDIADGYTARLFIQPSGVVSVQPDGNDFSEVQAFASLDGASFAQSATGYTALILANGWTNGPFGTANAAVENIGGVVRFEGAVSSGTAPQITTLPVGFRPAANVFLPVDLCNAVNGELEVTSAGTVTVLSESGSFADAQCLTSLDGASFLATTSSSTPLTLESGWTNAPSGTSSAAATEVDGIVHLQGAIETSGANRVPTTLPPAFWPASEVYVKADLCNAVSGQLGITPQGAVVMNVEGSNFPPTNCTISLDGVTFPGTPFTKLNLKNGWKAASGSATPGVALLSSPQGKVVMFQGAITTTGTNPVAFTLPKAFRPAWNVYLPVDLCNATNGRLYIQSTGVVTVEAETSFSDAQCLTSLDGASFVLKTKNGYESAILLTNGWTSDQTLYGTFQAADDSINGVIHLQGAVSGGTSNVIGTVAFHPATTVYIPVDLCSSTNGRVEIQTDGTISVDGNFSDAQCFTSLDGVTYGTTNPPVALTLENGWTGGAFNTANPAVDNIGGIVHFVGAMSTAGSNPVPFVLPVNYRPFATVRVKVDLCNAANGEMVITPDGTATINAEGGTFSNAQCFTSLDGVSFAR